MYWEPAGAAQLPLTSPLSTATRLSSSTSVESSVIVLSQFTDLRVVVNWPWPPLASSSQKSSDSDTNSHSPAIASLRLTAIFRIASASALLTLPSAFTSAAMYWYGDTTSAVKGPVPSGSILGLRPTASLSAARASAEEIAPESVSAPVKALLADRL